MRYSHVCLLAILLHIAVTPNVFGGFVYEDFTTDPNWTSLNNPQDNHSYGYSGGTNHAGGDAVGEIGGTTARDATNNFYADTTSIPTGMSLDDPLQASGQLIIRSASGWDHGILIGHFRETDIGDLAGILINEPSGPFNQSRVRAIVERDNGSNTIAATPTINLSRDVPHSFAYAWYPTGGTTGQGFLTFTIDGVTLTSEDTGGIFSLGERTASTPLLVSAFDSWGIAVPGAGVLPSTVQVFVDDLAFNFNAIIPEPASFSLLATGVLLLMLRRSR